MTSLKWRHNKNHKSRGYYDEYYADKKHTPDPFGRLDDLSSRAYR